MATELAQKSFVLTIFNSKTNQLKENTSIVFTPSIHCHRKTDVSFVNKGLFYEAVISLCVFVVVPT